jgi:hypothetical protein
MTPEGMKTTQLDQILLNGNNICLVSFAFVVGDIMDAYDR